MSPIPLTLPWLLTLRIALPRIRVMGTQLPLTKRGTAAPPHFLAHVYCGQTAGWMRMQYTNVANTHTMWTRLSCHRRTARRCATCAHRRVYINTVVSKAGHSLWKTGDDRRSTTTLMSDDNTCDDRRAVAKSRKSTSKFRALDRDSERIRGLSLRLKICLDPTYPDFSSPRSKGSQPPPQFSAHICCGQSAGWIKMPLGMEAGLGPGDCVQ